MHRDALSITPRVGHEIREEDLPGLVRAQPTDGGAEPFEIRRVRAEIGLGELLLLTRRETRFDDARDVAASVPHDAPVGVVGPDLAGEDRERGVALGEESAHAGERFRAQKRRVAVHDVRDAPVAVRSGERDADRVAGAAWDVLHRDFCALIEEVARGRGLR